MPATLSSATSEADIFEAAQADDLGQFGRPAPVAVRARLPGPLFVKVPRRKPLALRVSLLEEDSPGVRGVCFRLDFRDPPGLPVNHELVTSYQRNLRVPLLDEFESEITWGVGLKDSVSHSHRSFKLAAPAVKRQSGSMRHASLA